MAEGGPARAYHSPLPPTSLIPVLYSGLGIRSKLDYAFIATLAMLLLAVAGAVYNERPIAGLILNTLSTVAGCAGIVAWITFQVGLSVYRCFAAGIRNPALLSDGSWKLFGSLSLTRAA